MFVLLQEKGYEVIYKRENNKNPSITFDQNELSAVHLNNDIIAEVEGVGVMTDYELTSHFENVHLFSDIVKKHPEMSYNEIQLMLFANSDKFISVCGGNGILSSCFKGTVIMYVTQGRELRPNYFSNEGYFHQLSKAKIIPVFDLVEDIKVRGYHNINNIIKLIKEFK
jgi:hypothetical protein